MKGIKGETREATADVRQLVRSLANTLRGLEIANSEPSLLLAYQRLLTFLTSSDSGLIETVFGKCAATKRENRTTGSVIADNEIAELCIEDLEKILVNEDLPKAYLARIAAIRFSVTKGTLAKLSRETILIKLRSLIENEKTHQTIGRVARSSD